MKKLIATVVLALTAAGVSGVATAAPGPNGKNNHGLCTAYFNGSEQGRSNKQQKGPFVALMMEAANSDGVDNDDDGQTDEGDETTGAEGVWDYCLDYGIGGQPDDPNTPENDGPGKGKG